MLGILSLLQLQHKSRHSLDMESWTQEAGWYFDHTQKYDCRKNLGCH